MPSKLLRGLWTNLSDCPSPMCSKVNSCPLFWFFLSFHWINGWCCIFSSPDMGSGFCVTGKIEAGYIQTGDRILAMPPNETCTVKGLHWCVFTVQQGSAYCLWGINTLPYVTCILAGRFVQWVVITTATLWQPADLSSVCLCNRNHFAWCSSGLGCSRRSCQPDSHRHGHHQNQVKLLFFSFY